MNSTEVALDIRGTIFFITSNLTRQAGPFVMPGSVGLRVEVEDPLHAKLSAYFMSARDGSDENGDLESQCSREHDTSKIVDFKRSIARPVDVESYLVYTTAVILLNGDMYSNEERVEIVCGGADNQTPTNVEMDFPLDYRYSVARRLETLNGVVTSCFHWGF